MGDDNNHNLGCDSGVCRPKTASLNSETSDRNNSSSDSNDQKNLKIRIDIISDTMCPWCWVGKRNMEFALREIPEPIEANVHWLPFFLDKDLAEEGTLTEEYYLKNYGDAQTGERMKQPLTQAGKPTGIDFTEYCKVTHFRPTIRSHRLIEYADQHGKQDEMAEQLFCMFCEEGKPLNSIPHLIEAAQKLGFNKDHVQAYLESKTNEKQIFDLADSVRDLANGVPTFIFTLPDHEDVRYTFSGAASPEEFQTVFEKLIMHKKRLERLEKTNKNPTKKS